MKFKICLLCVYSFLSIQLFGQDFNHNDISIGFGAAVPYVGRFPLYDNKNDLSAAYGFRFSPLLQADVALDTVFHPVGTVFGPFGFDTKDHLYITQFGGRVVLPVRQRLTVGFGGGPAYVHYSTVESPAIGQIAFSRWAYYVLASAKLSLDRSGHFYVGSTPKFIGANGLTIGRFFILGGEFGVRF
jgi:hypothetical protein